MTEKKVSHFSQNVRKYGLMNTAKASFNTTVRQLTKMTGMCERKKKHSDSENLLPLHT